jgi:hypothetical protein
VTTRAKVNLVILSLAFANLAVWGARELFTGYFNHVFQMVGS